jgi:hypothetical protein
VAFSAKMAIRSVDGSHTRASRVGLNSLTTRTNEPSKIVGIEIEPIQ